MISFCRHKKLINEEGGLPEAAITAIKIASGFSTSFAKLLEILEIALVAFENLAILWNIFSISQAFLLFQHFSDSIQLSFFSR
jgi:hypothetical protein